MAIEKQWADLRKKYKLPDFKELDLDFEISAIEESNFPARSAIGKISEKIDFYSALLSELMQPDAANIYSMHETRFFDEEEKKSVYNLYCKLMGFNRKCIELSLKNSEKEDAEFISGFFEEWKSIKKELAGIVSKMGDSWSKETDVKEELEYFG